MTTMLQMFNVQEKKGRDIGIEIEMEGKHLLQFPNRFWAGIRDGSLRGTNPVEYVMKEPCKKATVVSRLNYLQKELKEHGSVLKPSGRCGVHVHVNCQELNTQQVINFALLYIILEDVLMQWCGEDRIGNMFCLRAKDAEKMIEALAVCRKSNNMRFIQDNNYRYASINLSALRKFGSVEFRGLGTPRRFSRIAKWAKMLLAIKEASLGYKEPFHIVEDTSMMGGRAFLKHVLGDLAKDVYCPGMDDMIYEGVQLVQEVAYTPVRELKIGEW